MMGSQPLSGRAGLRQDKDKESQPHSPQQQLGDMQGQMLAQARPHGRKQQQPMHLAPTACLAKHFLAVSTAVSPTTRGGRVLNTLHSADKTPTAHPIDPHQATKARMS